MRVNALTQSGLNQRLRWSAVSQKLGYGAYPLEELLSDITDEVTCNLRKGVVPEGEEFLVGVWMALGLSQNVPVYNQSLKEYTHRADQLYAPLPLSEDLYAPVLENACVVELDRLEGILKQSVRAARTEYDRDRIRYLLSQLNGMKQSNTLQ